jgi:hypothetical protein
VLALQCADCGRALGERFVGRITVSTWSACPFYPDRWLQQLHELLRENEVLCERCASLRGDKFWAQHRTANHT